MACAAQVQGLTQCRLFAHKRKERPSTVVALPNAELGELDAYAGPI